MTSLDKKIGKITDDLIGEFNALSPREKIIACKLMSYMKIRTIYQMINKYKNMTTQFCEDQQMILQDCVNDHLKGWSDIIDKL